MSEYEKLEQVNRNLNEAMLKVQQEVARLQESQLAKENALLRSMVKRGLQVASIFDDLEHVIAQEVERRNIPPVTQEQSKMYYSIMDEK